MSALPWLIIFICSRFLPRWKNCTVEHARNMNIYVEYESVENLKRITDKSYRSLCCKTIIYNCYSPRKPKLPGWMV